MVKIALQGLLYDEKSSFMRGAAKAPPLIREAYRSDSANFFAENGKEILPETFQDAGDISIGQYFEIERHTRGLLEGKRPLITLGGDHSISYPVLKAFHGLYGPLNILHIDAHSDLYDQFNGDRHSHACPFARIMEEGLASRLTQVGIRTLNQHQQKQAEKFGVHIFPLSDWGLEKLPTFKHPLYVSLDLDALDPAFAPGVSHHEPGGFSTRQVLDILRQLKAPLVGADIVEYNPDRDIHGMTAMVAAKFLKEIASLMV